MKADQESLKNQSKINRTSTEEKHEWKILKLIEDRLKNGWKKLQ